MKAGLIFALIVTACMCSEGGASGTVEPGEGEEYRPSPSAGGGKPLQDNEQTYRDFIRSHREAVGKLRFHEVMERVKQQESTLDNFILMLEQKKEPFTLTEDEWRQYKPLTCDILGLEEEDRGNDVYTIKLMRVCLNRLLEWTDFGTIPLPGVRRDLLLGVTELTLKVVCRPYGAGERSITTSGVCSGGGASEKDEEDKPSSSAGGKKSSQDDERIRDYMKNCMELSEPLLQGIVERVKQEESRLTLNKFALMVYEKEEKKEPFTDDERTEFESCACEILGLKKEDLDGDVVTSTVMRFGLKLLLDFAVFGIIPLPEVPWKRQDHARAIQLMSNMAYIIPCRPGRRSMTTSDGSRYAIS
jgi:hypothetical protein